MCIRDSSISGRKLKTDSHGTWLNHPSHTDWRPAEVTDDADWENLNANERAIMRRMWPDPSRPKKMVPDPKASGVSEGDPVMIDQDELLEREAYELNWCGLTGDEQFDPDDEVFSPNVAHKNHWIETKGYWIYWKAKPSKGIVHPNGHIMSDNKPGPRSISELLGDRITRAFFAGQTFPEILVERNFFGGKHTERSTGLGCRLCDESWYCLLYTSPSPRDRTRSRMPSSA